MNKKLLFTMLALVMFAGSYAQGSLWKPVKYDRIAALPRADRESLPSEYQLFSLDFGLLKTQLQSAPHRDSQAVSTLIIPFPGTDGKMNHFRIYEAPVMHPDLAASFPDSKSYVGVGVENPADVIRFSTTMFGLHTMTLSNKTGTSYIDPFTKDLNNYIVYEKQYLSTQITRTCHVQDDPSQDAGRSNTQLLANDGVFRTYRLAMASTVEYSNFHINAAGLNSGTTAQKKAAVLAAMNVTMTRVNGLYERDMSLTMQLVPNNVNIIFIGFDSFDNDNAGTLINQSQTVIDANIGPANYDIGHTVSTGGGGLAQLNSPCTANKARGITGSPAPVGDPYDIDYVAHEMGHQFGAQHTFNNSCNGNVSTGTSVEPGSGSTIMGYAGICAPDVQSNSDAHFHAVSLAQMQTFVSGTGNCAVSVPNNNAAPVVNAGADYLIPRGTAFVLRGAATDANGDVLTYTWEQTNTEMTTQPPTATATTGPNFRSNPPSLSPNRYMPSMSSVLANNLVPTWEVVPNVARSMNFALTVRDNRMPNGGQTGRDNMVVTTSTVGPFKVTSQSTSGISWTQNTTQTINWDVAGTTANGINTANVNILLSTDGGQTWNTVLAANTPNDGTQTITVPNVAAPFCRIMVEAVGNIFFAVNPQTFAIGYIVSNTCNTYTNNTPMPIPDGAGNNVAGPTVTSTINIPTNVNITDVNVTLNGVHTYYWDLITTVLHPDGSSARLLNRICNQTSTGFNVVFNDASPAIACAAALNGTFAPNQPLAVFNNKPSNGIWTLAVNDNYGGDTGTITSWAIEVCSQSIQLANPTFGLAEFAVYPNPNNGNFTVKFNSSSTNPINISVHDIRGRSIFENQYNNAGLFSEQIQLDKVQSGVYLVTVQDGDQKDVRKIIIE
ncbi:MAG TPA: zinc-dependent metalloprotease family protein [Flavobacterium sp.]|jgi:subtilisin-like proprotein convertase family protein